MSWTACYNNFCETNQSNKDRLEQYLKTLRKVQELCTIRMRDLELSIVEQTWAPVCNAESLKYKSS